MSHPDNVSGVAAALAVAPVDLVSIVDDYCLIKAEIDDLEAKQAELKKQLIDSGQSELMGTLHKITVTPTAGRNTTDWKTIATLLTPPPTLVAQHTKTGDPGVAIRVYGR